MSAPYVYLAARKTTEKVETAQDTTNAYFWGAVIAVLVLTGVFLLVLYGLQPSEGAEEGLPRSLGGIQGGQGVLAQLPLYLGSTQFSDPPESV